MRDGAEILVLSRSVPSRRFLPREIGPVPSRSLFDGGSFSSLPVTSLGTNSALFSSKCPVGEGPVWVPRNVSLSLVSGFPVTLSHFHSPLFWCSLFFSHSLLLFPVEVPLASVSVNVPSGTTIALRLPRNFDIIRNQAVGS